MVITTAQRDTKTLLVAGKRLVMVRAAVRNQASLSGTTHFIRSTVSQRQFIIFNKGEISEFN